MRYSVVDMTAPTASPSVPPVPSSGWYISDVTVTWNWDDGDGVGIDTGDCLATSVSSGGGTVVVSGTCQDSAGNVASASVTVNVDTHAASFPRERSFPCVSRSGSSGATGNPVLSQSRPQRAPFLG